MENKETKVTLYFLPVIMKGIAKKLGIKRKKKIEEFIQSLRSLEVTIVNENGKAKIKNIKEM
jgi:hypothetical protein